VADSAKVKLHTRLGNYPNTKALKSGEIRSDLIDFDFVEVEVANNLFKKVVREAAYDFAELAIVTYLQARTYGKPYVLLPAVVVGRGQQYRDPTRSSAPRPARSCWRCCSMASSMPRS
jgi:4,5-dihydroxyphthalate decarboxylase